jgi:hypothetical protein
MRLTGCDLLSDLIRAENDDDHRSPAELPCSRPPAADQDDSTRNQAATMSGSPDSRPAPNGSRLNSRGIAGGLAYDRQ